MSLVDTETGEVVAMNRAQAEAITAEIKAWAGTLWQKLRQAHQGRAWIALGYATWADYVQAEFDIGKSQSYRLLAHSRAIAEFADAAGLVSESPIGDIPEHHTRDIDPAAVAAEVAEQVDEHTPDDQRVDLVKRTVTEHYEASKPAREEISKTAEQDDRPAADAGSPPAPAPSAPPAEDEGDGEAMPAASDAESGGGATPPPPGPPAVRSRRLPRPRDRRGAEGPSRAADSRPLAARADRPSTGVGRPGPRRHRLGQSRRGGVLGQAEPEERLMRLTDEQRTAVNAAMAEAHAEATRPDGSVASAAVPVHFLRILREMEGIDPGFIGAYLHSLEVTGASRVASAWRKAQAPTPAKTPKGTRVDAPRFIGTTRIAPDGKTEHVQLRIEGMSEGDIARAVAREEKSRNSSSRRITWLKGVLARMRETGCTAEQALADLRAA